jgi:hypothetical protein
MDALRLTAEVHGFALTAQGNDLAISADGEVRARIEGAGNEPRAQRDQEIPGDPKEARAALEGEIARTLEAARSAHSKGDDDNMRAELAKLPDLLDVSRQKGVKDCSRLVRKKMNEALDELDETKLEDRQLLVAADKALGDAIVRLVVNAVRHRRWDEAESEVGRLAALEKERAGSAERAELFRFRLEGARWLLKEKELRAQVHVEAFVDDPSSGTLAVINGQRRVAGDAILDKNGQKIPGLVLVEINEFRMTLMVNGEKVSHVVDFR